jgi:hypothetical protein
LERLAVATALYLARVEFGRLRALPQPYDSETAERRAFDVATYYLQRAGFRSGLNVDEQEELRAMLRVVD